MKECFWVNRKNLNHQAKQPTDTQTAVFKAQHDTHKLETNPLQDFRRQTILLLAGAPT